MVFALTMVMQTSKWHTVLCVCQNVAKPQTLKDL